MDLSLLPPAKAARSELLGEEAGAGLWSLAVARNMSDGTTVLWCDSWWWSSAYGRNGVGDDLRLRLMAQPSSESECPPPGELHMDEVELWWCCMAGGGLLLVDRSSGRLKSGGGRHLLLLSAPRVPFMCEYSE